MARRVLVDTGPLVAIFQEIDSNHSTCMRKLEELEAPLLTCWPVLTEAAYLLRNNRKAVQTLLRQTRPDKLLQILPLGVEATGWIEQFFDRFSDHEPQLADASLVYLAEREGIETVFTLDRRDFTIYRTSDNRALQIVPEA